MKCKYLFLALSRVPLRPYVRHKSYLPLYIGAAVAEWLSSWLAEQGTGVRFPASSLEFSEIGYLLLPSRDMAEIPLNRRK